MATLAQEGSCGQAAWVPAMPPSLSPCDHCAGSGQLRVWLSIVSLLGTQSWGRVPVRLYPATLDLFDLSSKNQMLLDRHGCCSYMPALPYVAVPSCLEQLLVTAQRRGLELSCALSCQIPSAVAPRGSSSVTLLCSWPAHSL